MIGSKKQSQGLNVCSKNVGRATEYAWRTSSFVREPRLNVRSRIVRLLDKYGNPYASLSVLSQTISYRTITVQLRVFPLPTFAVSLTAALKTVQLSRPMAS